MVNLFRLVTGKIRRFLFGIRQPFTRSSEYWEKRYQAGLDSGTGSYDELAQFKAGFLNEFVKDNAVSSVVEFGCGDGNQLGLAEYPRYLGVDVSSTAVSLCKQLYDGDRSKSFLVLPEYADETADLSLSLDVIYHLVEDEVYTEYMSRLFNAAARHVIIYSTNQEEQESGRSKHVRHRRFTDWVEAECPDWEHSAVVPNPFADNPVWKAGSEADFHVYTRKSQ